MSRPYRHWVAYPLYCALSEFEKAHKGENTPLCHVVHLLHSVHRKSEPYLSADDLKRLGIKLSTMDLETGKPADSGPQFCEPYPHQEFDKLFEKVSAKSMGIGPKYPGEGAYAEADRIEQYIVKCLSDLGVFYCFDPAKRITAYRCRSRNKTVVEQGLDNVSAVFSRQPEWQVSAIFDPYDKSTPHRGCALEDGAISDDRLRLSEVFCAAALMSARMAVTGDRIVPVFIYSFSGYRARVIQAHYEDSNFIVRKTDNFEFEDGSVDAFKLMLRWMLNTPMGVIKKPRPAKRGLLRRILRMRFDGGKWSW